MTSNQWELSRDWIFLLVMLVILLSLFHVQIRIKVFAFENKLANIGNFLPIKLVIAMTSRFFIDFG
jgi:hypothetical protein